MAETVERLAVLIEANTKTYERAMSRLENVTNQSIRRSSRSVDTLGSRISSLSGTLRTVAGLFGVAFGGRAFVNAIEGAISSVADLGDAAEAAGVSAERLQVFRTFISQNGAAVRDADDALKRFNRRLGEFANSGAGPAARAFQALGISIVDGNGALRDSQDIFDDVLERLSSIDDQARVSALAAQLFGDDAGPRLLQALRQGTRGMQETEDRMRELGIIMSSEMVQKAKDVQDEMAFLGQIISTRFNQAVLNAIGVSDDGTRAMERFASKLGDFFDLIANNIDVVIELGSALAGFLIAGPIGAAVGLLIPPLVNMGLAAATSSDQVDEATQSLVNIGIATGDLIDQSPDYIRMRADQVKADYEAAAAAQALLAAHIAELRAKVPGFWETMDPRAALTEDYITNILIPDLEAGEEHLSALAAGYQTLIDLANQAGQRTTSTTPPGEIDFGGGAAAAKQLKTLDEIVASYQDQLRQLRLTDRELAIYNALTEAGADANSALGEEIAKTVGDLYDQVKQLERLNDALDTVKDLASDFFHTFKDGLEEGKTAAEALNAALADLKSRLLDLLLDVALNFLFDAISGGLSNLFGRAGGGAVAGGQPYMVGERGPELFVPHSAGVIRPSGTGEGKGTVVQVINNTGAPVREERGRAPDGRELVRLIIGTVSQAVTQGDLDRPFAGRFGARPMRAQRGA